MLAFPFYPRQRIEIETKWIFKYSYNLCFNKKYKLDIINKFETLFAQKIGTKYAIATPSGRNALALLLKAYIQIGLLKEGDEIIVAAYNYYIIPSVISRCGLKPVFVDVDAETFVINSANIKTKLTSKTKAVLITHLFGRIPDMRKIKKLARRYSLIIIEDCAHAIDTTYNGKHVGTFGDSIFSLELTKPIHTLGGGVIVTSNDKLAKLIQKEINSNKPKLTNFPLTKLAKAYIVSFLLKPPLFFIFIYPLLLLANFTRIELGVEKKELNNFLIKNKTVYTPYQAEIGMEQIKNSAKKNERLAFLRDCYNKEFLKLNMKDELIIPIDKQYEKSSLMLYTIRIKNATKLKKHLLLNGVDTKMHYISYCPSIYHQQGSFPIAKKLEQEVIHLPFYPMKEKAALILAKKITRILNKYKNKESGKNK